MGLFAVKRFEIIEYKITLMLIVVLCIGIFFASTPQVNAAGEAFTSPDPINGTINEPIAISGLQITGTGNDILHVSLNLTNDDDTSMQMTTTTGITFVGASTGTVLRFSGTRSNINAALATLQLTAGQPVSVSIRAAIVGADEEVYNHDNGHVYKVVEDSNTWAQAKTAAELATYDGISGYLASITSNNENNLLLGRYDNIGWIGGTDADAVGTEGTWEWAGGPDDGLLFWIGIDDGSAVEDAFTNWADGQPDNFGGGAGEDCLEVYDNSGRWNDQDCSLPLNYYTIEFGDGVTNPDIETGEVDVEVYGIDTDNDGISDLVEVGSPNSGDANDDNTPDYQQSNVIAYPNDLTGEYGVFETDCESIDNFSVSAESTDEPDNEYDYPMGLASFEITCENSGDTARIRHYYYGIEGSDEFSVRKLLSDGSYVDIPEHNPLGALIGDDVVFLVEYFIEDGGEFDDDDTADGTVTDPSGAAVLAGADPSGNAETLADTGMNQYALIAISVLSLFAGVITIRHFSYRS